MLIPNNSPVLLPWQDDEPAPVWSDVFGNSNPLALEIGCGVGDFIVQMAAQHPDINFIALDFYNKGCIKTCKRVEKSGLKNVRVLRAEARSFIDSCIPVDTLKKVIVNCPDPWPKLRHRKRRLVNSTFVGYLAGFMKSEADLYFATDFVDYGLDVAEFMSVQPGFKNQLVPDTFRHYVENYPVSKYMKRFMDLGQPIYYVHYRKA